jgi:hypothetical protein
MPLADYSHAFAMGFNCTPVWQLRREAERVGMSVDRIKGPFDWISVPLNPVVDVLNNGFQGFFRPEESDIVGTLGCRWQVLNRQGFLSVHNLVREEGATSVSAQAWERFGQMQKQRIAAWEGALTDPNANVLIVRQQCPGWPDEPERVASLAKAIVDRSRAAVTIAAVALGPPTAHCHPLVRALSVEQSWPDDLPEGALDWNHDYGWGVAWEGHQESWDRVWQQV